MQMIKTFIALLSVTGVAFAVDTTRVFDLKGDVVAGDGLGYLYSYDPSTRFGTFEDDANVSGDLLSWLSNNGKVQTSVTFTLDLTDVMAAAAESEFTTPVELVNLDLNAMDIGLYLTTEGIEVGKAKNSLQGTELRYDSLLSNPGSFEGKSGDTYITLTFVQYQDGVKIFGNSSSDLIFWTYRNANNSSLNSIKVNTEYIEGVQFYNAWATNGNFADVNGGFDLEMKGKLCPEPATAMLSLLALAGLAARRRRK